MWLVLLMVPENMSIGTSMPSSSEYTLLSVARLQNWSSIYLHLITSTTRNLINRLTTILNRFTYIFSARLFVTLRYRPTQVVTRIGLVVYVLARLTLLYVNLSSA